jgi:ABC-type transport system involved in multi-copper enzyme maturation permease subunit
MRAVRIIALDALAEMAKRKILLAVLLAAAFTACIFIVAVAFTPAVVQRLVQQATGPHSGDPLQAAAFARQLNAQGYNLEVSLFCGAIELIGTLLALVMFSTFLPWEIERGSIKFLISRPVSRLDVALGKGAAGAAVILGYSILAGLLQLGASLYLTGGLAPEDIRTMPFLFCKLLLRGSAALWLSMVMRPILAGVLAFFISGDIFSWPARFTEGAPHYVFLAVSFILPNYSIFPLRSFLTDIARAVGFHVPDLTLLDIAARGAYAGLYICVMFALAMRALNRKDLT